MLYDNALLVDLLTEAWRETQDPLYAQRVAETVDWLAREMIADGGGFGASLDADSEGEEGKFYVWSAAEILDVLGAEDAAFFGRVYDVSVAGNWEGHTILNRLDSLAALAEADEARLAALRQKLLQRRAQRIRPGWDDKVLADWNGLMIAALARAAVVFARPEWLAMAERAFDFVATRMAKDDGRLWHSFRDGRAKAPATAADYANMIWAAIRLHEATGASRYVDRARVWVATLDRHYWRTDGDGYAMTADDTDDVIVRLANAHDDATPNANAVMVSNLVHLWLLTGEAVYRERAVAIPQAFAREVAQAPLGHCGLIANAIELIAPTQVVVVSGETGQAQALVAALHSLSLPGALVQVVADTTGLPDISPLAGKTAIDGKPTGYVCAGFSCSAPVVEADSLRVLVEEGRRAFRRVTNA